MESQGGGPASGSTGPRQQTSHSRHQLLVRMAQEAQVVKGSDREHLSPVTWFHTVRSTLAKEIQENPVQKSSDRIPKEGTTKKSQ